MAPHSRWLIILAVFAGTSLSACNCGNSRIVNAPDGGNPYARYAPTSGLTAGATVSKSQNFKMIGAVDAPAGTSARSQNFQLKGGVVEAAQDEQPRP
ncbi:MAG: hypothetical protein JNM17_34125 [Archangium sp.]|nr:hypothetical protein [Archangium sp.]